MIRLVFCGLRYHAITWVGAFVVAVVCGYLGGWVLSIEQTTSGYRNLQDFWSVVLAFSSIAAVPVLVSTANLTVSVQRRSYALWQLVNVSPCRVSVVVLMQLAVVALLGAIVGTLIEAATFGPLFPIVFSSYDPPTDMDMRVGAPLMWVVWLVVTALFSLGGLRGARSAGRTPPLLALRDSKTVRERMTWLRVLLFVGLLLGMCRLIVFLSEVDVITAGRYSLFVPLFMIAMLTSVAPGVLSALLSAWTSFVPQNRWSAWYLARRTARHGLGESTAVETPSMVGVGLVSGIFSISNAMGLYVQQQGMTEYNTSMDWTTTLLLLGGPVLLCAVGAAVSVMMTSGSRMRDTALLTALGAQPKTLFAAAVCEAFIHAITATVAGIVSAVVSNTIVTCVFGMSPCVGLSLGQGFVVSFIGFVLVLVATLVPTIVALLQEPAPALSTSI